MPPIDYLGYVAGFFTTFAIVPQILRVYRLKSAREISILFNSSMLLGILCWVAYGIVLMNAPLIVWNAIGACLTTTLLFAKLRYGR